MLILHYFNFLARNDSIWRYIERVSREKNLSITVHTEVYTIIHFIEEYFFLVTSQFLFLARLIRAVIKLFPLSKEQ